MEPWYTIYTKDNDIVSIDNDDFVIYKDTDGKYVAIGRYYGGLGSYSSLKEAKGTKWNYYKFVTATDIN